MNFENKNANILKKGLRFLGMVATISINIVFFLFLFFRLDLITEALTSTPVVGVVCLVVGGAIGFIAGAIAIYLHTCKAVEARDERIQKLQRKLEKLEEEHSEACKALAKLLPQQINKEKKAAEAAYQKKVAEIFGEIADLLPSEPSQDEEVSES